MRSDSSRGDLTGRLQACCRCSPGEIRRRRSTAARTTRRAEFLSAVQRPDASRCGEIMSIQPQQDTGGKPFGDRHPVRDGKLRSVLGADGNPAIGATQLQKGNLARCSCVEERSNGSKVPPELKEGDWYSPPTMPAAPRPPIRSTRAAPVSAAREQGLCLHCYDEYFAMRQRRTESSRTFRLS